jgi:hypothetical protein
MGYDFGGVRRINQRPQMRFIQRWQKHVELGAESVRNRASA